MKNKKDKNEKEKTEFEDLEIGKKLLDRKLSDPNKFQQEFQKFPKDMQQEYSRCLHAYVGSTNYGKGESFAATMMGIPAATIGLAADVGLHYVAMKRGFIWFGGPSLTVLTGLLGAGTGATIYADKHEEDFHKEHTETYGKKKPKDLTKSLDKFIDEDINWVRKNYDGAVVYDPMNNAVAREKGRDYSETDKQYLEWQKKHIRDYTKNI